jgi:7-cyano-7-deazaguanine synthase
MSKAVVVISGGLDSVTLAHYVSTLGFDEVLGISFNYGQRHKKEVNYASYQMHTIPGGSHRMVSLGSITSLLENSGSSLVTGEDVPEGHYAEENMKATVVPNRNMIMLSIAAAYAISENAEAVFTGVHAGDHFIYPDCREAFIRPANAAIVRGNAGFGPIAKWNEDPSIMPQQFIYTPFIEWTKADIAKRAFELNIDVSQTWSCYKGGDIHCGRCGTCVERLEAIASTGHEDPTTYADDEFWKQATTNV